MEMEKHNKRKRTAKGATSGMDTNMVCNKGMSIKCPRGAQHGTTEVPLKKPSVIINVVTFVQGSTKFGHQSSAEKLNPRVDISDKSPNIEKFNELIDIEIDIIEKVLCPFKLVNKARCNSTCLWHQQP